MKPGIIKLIAFIAMCFGTAAMALPSTAAARPLQISGSVHVNLGTPHHYYHRRRPRTVVIAPQIVEHRDNGNRSKHHGNGHRNKGEHRGNDKH